MGYEFLKGEEEIRRAKAAKLRKKEACKKAKVVAILEDEAWARRKALKRKLVEEQVEEEVHEEDSERTALAYLEVDPDKAFKEVVAKVSWEEEPLEPPRKKWEKSFTQKGKAPPKAILVDILTPSTSNKVRVSPQGPPPKGIPSHSREGRV